jgi:hypothetical protein
MFSSSIPLHRLLASSNMRSFIILSAALALGQQALAVATWGQCGGQGYTGSTVCDAGSVCTYSNRTSSRPLRVV